MAKSKQLKSEGRLIALDVGIKRTGLAVTDSMQMIASPIKGCLTKDLFQQLDQLIGEEPCAGLVIGDPVQMDGQASESATFIHGLVDKLKKKYPDTNIYREDERFSSRLASKSLVAAGLPKMKRQDKLRVDSTSAAIILQSFLQRNKK